MSKMLSLFGVLLPLLCVLALASPVDARPKGGNHDDDSSDHRSRDDDSSDDDSRDQGPPNDDADPGNCTAPSSLVSWWPAEGNADDAWGDNDGTLVDVTFSPGKVGQAFDFSGTLDYVQVPHSTSLDFSASDSYTVEFWMKTEGMTEGHPALVEKFANSSTFAYPFAVRLNTGDPNFPSTVGPKGTVFCGVFDGTNFPFVWSSMTVDDDEFHHVACVFNGTSKSIEVYVDGHLDGFQNYAILNDVATEEDLFFGIRGNLDPFFDFNRLLDEISIYSAALSATDISDIFDGGDAGKCRSTQVDIDVKPFSRRNVFSRRGPGFIPVAINGSADFSPLDIDFSTLVFEAPELGIHPRQGPHCKIVDWNRDDYLDAVCFFKDKPRRWEIGRATGTLTGELFDGTAIEGSDSIRVVRHFKKAHRRHRRTK